MITMYTSFGQDTISTIDIVNELTRRAYYVATQIPIEPTTPPLTTPLLQSREQIIKTAVDIELSMKGWELYSQFIYYTDSHTFNNVVTGALTIANRLGVNLGYIFTFAEISEEINNRGYYIETSTIQLAPRRPSEELPVAPLITTYTIPSITTEIVITPVLKSLTREQIINMALDQELTSRGWSLYSATPVMVDENTFNSVTGAAAKIANRIGATYYQTFTTDDIGIALNGRGYYFVRTFPPVETPELTPILPADISPGIPTYIPIYTKLQTFLPTPGPSPEWTPEPAFLPVEPVRAGFNWALYLILGAVGMVFVGKEHIKKRRKKPVTPIP